MVSDRAQARYWRRIFNTPDNFRSFQFEEGSSLQWWIGGFTLILLGIAWILS